MSLDLTNYEQLTKNAVAHFWSAGNTALDQQIARGDAAFKYNKFGTLKPFIGYLILMKDCPEVHKPVAVAERHFKVFEEFKEASYARRGELLCKRLVGERLYDAATILLSPEEEGKQGKYSELNEASGLKEWVALLAGHVAAVAATRKPSSHSK